MEKPMVFGGYRVCTGYNGCPVELKRSALGVVTYKAQDTESKEPVILKVIPAASFDSERLERLQKHVEQARSLQHPNIAKVLHFGSVGDEFVYVEEYVDGETVASWVKEHGAMAVDVALRIGLQVAEALSAAAFHLSPHRAISPRNLILASGQTAAGEWPFIKLINFGLAEIEFAEAAKQIGRGLENDALIFYRSPEHGQRSTVDLRSDIYSLGCTLWFLLTGAPPFTGEGASVLAPAVMTEPPVEELKRLPKSMRSLLAYMLRRNPEERPLDPVALTQVIEHSLARIERRQAFARSVGMPFLAPTYVRKKVIVAQPEEERPERASGWFARTAAAAAIVILLAALVAAFGTWQLGTNTIFSSSSIEKPIGVPIGVPEPSVVPPVANNRVAQTDAAKGTEPNQPLVNAAQTPATVAAANSVDSSAQATPPSVNPPAAPSQVPSPPVASPNSTDVPVAGLASNETSSRNNLGAPNSGAEVAPPAEAPSEIGAGEAAAAKAPYSSPTVVTENANDLSTDVAANAKEDANSGTAPPSNAPESRPTPSKRIVSHRAKKRHEVRRALPPDSETVSSSRTRHVIRAEFLGTTPDGNWVLGIGGTHATMVVPPPPPEVSRSVLENGVRITLPPDY